MAASLMDRKSVLLTHSNHLYSDPKQMEKMQPYPPLQTILAAAVLRENGITPHLFDPTLDYSPGAFRAALDRARPDLIAVCEDDLNFISKMCLAHNRALAFEFARMASEAGIRCVAHGADASDHVAEYLGAGFCAVLTGDIEYRLLGFVTGNPRPFEVNLDTLPAPAWDLVEMGKYRAAWANRHGRFSLNLASSRGCPFRCNWCAKPIFGSRYRVRAAASVAAEMSYVKRRYAPDHIWFADDIFALSSRWTYDFAREVERLGASLPFKMQSRCELMTRGAVAALRQAGCEEVWMGAESGSQRVLDAMEKDLSVDAIRAACRNLRDHGIRACLFLQFGYPGEHWEEVEQTIRMVREAAPDDVGISVSYPLPGTRFHQIVRNQMGTKTNWEDSADLSMMYRGAFSTEFYRALADALHTEVRGGSGQNAAWRRVEELRAA